MSERHAHRFLDVTRALALVSTIVAPAATVALSACAGGAPSATSPVPSGSASAAPSTVATVTPDPPGDPTAGGGPCRCSWDTNQAGAPRVCKKNEKNYQGAPCVPGAHVPDDDMPMGVGPLPPPELPA